MDILEALAQSAPSPATIEATSHGHMHPEVFKVALAKCGLDEETIEDCLFEPHSRWDDLLEYFETRGK